MFNDPEIFGAVQSLRNRHGRRPWQGLLSAVLALAQGKGELLKHTESNWASVTFAGTRHALTLQFAGDEAIAAGEILIAALPDHEFSIPRQLVADAAVLSVSHSQLPQPNMLVELELLLVEDC